MATLLFSLLSFCARCAIASFCALHLASAQTRTADSLKLLLRNPMPDTAQIDIMNMIGSTTRNTNFDTSFRYARSAREMAEKIGYLKGVVFSQRTIGATLSNQGLYKQAVDTLLTALELVRRTKDTEGEAFVLNTIGYMLKSTQLYSQASQYFEQSLKLFSGLSHPRGMCLVLGNIGDVYFLQNNYPMALEYEFKALEYAKKTKENYLSSVTFFHLGTIYTRLQKYDSARLYQEKALLLFQVDNLSKYIAKSLNNLAEITFAQRQYPTSILYGKKGLEVARSIYSYEDAARISLTLSDAWKSLGNYKEAHRYLLTYTEWKDSLTVLNIQQKLEQFRSSQEVAEKQKKIQILEKDRENQELLRNSLVGGVLFSLVLLGVAVNRYRIKRRSEAELQQKQDILESQAHEIQLFNTQLQETNLHLQESYQVTQSLGEIGRSITATLELPTIGMRLYQNVNAMMDASVLLVYAHHFEERELERILLIEDGEIAPTMSISMDDISRPAVQCVVEQKEIVVQESTLPAVSGKPSAAFVYLPLIVEGHCIGAFSVQSFTPNAYSEQDITVLRTIQPYIAAAMNNAGAYRKLEQTLETLRRTQNQLVQAEKMASLGTLVAGVAHELNTPIGVAITAASTLHGKVEEFESEYQSGGIKKSTLENFITTSKIGASLTLRNLERAASLVQSFKQVAVDQTSDAKRRFKLNGYLHEIITNLQPKLKTTKHRVEIECEETLELETYPGAIAQIITNFVMNSLLHGFEGYTEEGLIRIEVKDEGGSLQDEHPQTLHKQITIIYSDNGRGIAPEVLPRIFDPFFTTKQAQGGTGLGMHIVYNLVTQKLSGTLRTESKVGDGAYFYLHIPNTIHSSL